MALIVKSSPANVEDKGSIPGSRRSLGGATHSSVLAWKIPGTEKPGGLQSKRVAKESDMSERHRDQSGPTQGLLFPSSDSTPSPYWAGGNF